jgi:hypothetical protein
MNKELEYSWKFDDFGWITSKILIVTVVAIIVVGWSLPSTMANVNTQKAMALGATTTNTVIVLQSPLYTEDDKTTSQKAIFVNGTTPARTVTFSGHGMAKDVNYTDSGEGLVIPRGISGVIDSRGQGAMITTGGGKASFTFHEIGHSDANGTITATGAAFFDANASGKIAFLGNAVAIYKDQVYKNGTDKVIAWEWK